MRNLKLKLAYDGTEFHGWQVQPNQPTIQGMLEAVLGEIEGDAVKVHGAGRTDAGVHSLEQVASFHLGNPIPAENLRKAMNRLLPPAIRVLDVEEAEPAFHARYSATAKRYEYRLWRAEICPPWLSRYVYHHPYALDEACMAAAAGRFVGTHDFLSLAADEGGQVESTVRTIFLSSVDREDQMLVYRVRGTGFLYRMVRNIAGTLLEVGRGNLTPDDVDLILAGKKRSDAGPTAPARGLFLVAVEYEGQPQPDPTAPESC